MIDEQWKQMKWMTLDQLRELRLRELLQRAGHVVAWRESKTRARSRVQPKPVNNLADKPNTVKKQLSLFAG